MSLLPQGLRSVAAAALALPLAAAAAMYRCPSPGDPGAQIVTNLLSEADAKQRECVPLNQRTSTLDAPSAAAEPAPTRRASAAPPQRKVSPRIQRLRDDERRLILESELRNEQEALERVRQRGPAQAADAGERRRWEQDVARHSADVEAIKRELSRLP